MEALSSGISSVLTWLIQTTLYVSTLICLILLLKAITGRRLPAWWHYGLWLLLVARMLMPWVPESRLSLFNYMPAASVQSLADVVVAGSHQDRAAIEFLRQLLADNTLFSVWLAGVIIVGTSIVFKNSTFWSIIRREPLVTDQTILNLLETCKSQMKIQTVVGVIITDKVKSPALFGYLRPRLLLPKGILEKLNENQLCYVFLHELGHLKRHDIAISSLTTFLQTVHWFNPLVWYAFYQMRVDQEAACDAYVLSRFKNDQSPDYANTIVGLLESFCQNRQLPALVGILENKSQIKRRLTMVIQSNKYSKKLTLLAASLLLSVCFIFFTCAQKLVKYDLNQVDEKPQITGRALPIYPYDAKMAGLKGWVMIKCLVGTDGLATEIKAVEADPEDVLDIFGPPCVEAVRNYVFSPGKIAGKPVPTRVAFRIVFELGEKSDEKTDEVTP